MATTSTRSPPRDPAGLLHPDHRAGRDRSVLVKSPYVDYLAAELQNLTDLKVRQALAECDQAGRARSTPWWWQGKAFATDRSVVPDNLPGYQQNPAFDGPPAG